MQCSVRPIGIPASTAEERGLKWRWATTETNRPSLLPQGICPQGKLDLYHLSPTQAYQMGPFNFLEPFSHREVWFAWPRCGRTWPGQTKLVAGGDHDQPHPPPLKCPWTLFGCVAVWRGRAAWETMVCVAAIARTPSCGGSAVRAPSAPSPLQGGGHRVPGSAFADLCWSNHSYDSI